jgi:membrane protein implicated in regulation of membrane protease activity
MELLEQVSYWHWLVLGVILVTLEIFAPGAILIWMGISAGVVGLLMVFISGMSWEYQILLFAIFSIVSIVLWHQYLKKHPTETDQPRLNRRGEQYVDRTFTLDEPIVNGLGKIYVDDSSWKISGEDCPAGTKVVVVGVDGVVLKVRPD